MIHLKQRRRQPHSEPVSLVAHARNKDSNTARGNALASAADEALREAQTQTGHFFLSTDVGGFEWLSDTQRLIFAGRVLKTTSCARSRRESGSVAGTRVCSLCIAICVSGPGHFGTAHCRARTEVVSHVKPSRKVRKYGDLCVESGPFCSGGPLIRHLA
jgi:hypothetical protein